MIDLHVSTSGRGAKVGTNRQIEEATARCVAIIVYYQNLPGAKEKAAMSAELQAEARSLGRCGLREGVDGDRLVGGVKAELIARYGAEVGGQLHGEFVRAFEGRPAPPQPIFGLSPPLLH
jgi:hypothetical protein